VTIFYLDTSAAIKLLAEESHSSAFCRFYDNSDGATWVTSALLRVELVRTIRRAMPEAESDARDLLEAFDFIAIDDPVIEAAMNEPGRMLRSLDAIHLATARALGDDLAGLATYDDRLATAAVAAGIPVIDPRDPRPDDGERADHEVAGDPASPE
jgi:predicted nucleic acid-binding protein